jgi:hypothetical protein
MTVRFYGHIKGVIMSDENKLVPFNEIPESGVDLNLAVEQAKKMTAVLDAMGIEKATFKSGAIFNRDGSSNAVTVATDGLIVQQREHSTTVIFRHEGSSEREAIEELTHAKLTQEALGSFSGKSQPWASRVLSHGDKNE